MIFIFFPQALKNKAKTGDYEGQIREQRLLSSWEETYFPHLRKYTMHQEEVIHTGKLYAKVLQLPASQICSIHMPHSFTWNLVEPGSLTIFSILHQLTLLTCTMFLNTCPWNVSEGLESLTNSALSEEAFYFSSSSWESFLQWVIKKHEKLKIKGSKKYAIEDHIVLLIFWESALMQLYSL